MLTLFIIIGVLIAGMMLIAIILLLVFFGIKLLLNPSYFKANVMNNKAKALYEKKAKLLQTEKACLFASLQSLGKLRLTMATKDITSFIVMSQRIFRLTPDYIKSMSIQTDASIKNNNPTSQKDAARDLPIKGNIYQCKTEPDTNKESPEECLNSSILISDQKTPESLSDIAYKEFLEEQKNEKVPQLKQRNINIRPLKPQTYLALAACKDMFKDITKISLQPVELALFGILGIPTDCKDNIEEVLSNYAENCTDVHWLQDSKMNHTSSFLGLKIPDILQVELDFSLPPEKSLVLSKANKNMEFVKDFEKVADTVIEHIKHLKQYVNEYLAICDKASDKASLINACMVQYMLDNESDRIKFNATAEELFLFAHEYATIFGTVVFQPLLTNNGSVSSEINRNINQIQNKLSSLNTQPIPV